MDEAVYELFDTNAGYQAAVQRLLQQPGRELRIFDRDGASLRLNDPGRIEALEAFLAASRTRRLFLVVHDTDHITRKCPRMITLLTRFAHAVQINRTDESLRELKDCFLVLDAAHYVRRPVSSFFRGAMGLADEAEAVSMRARFLEIWERSFPAVSASTAGL